MTPRPKFAYIRSPKLLKACRCIPCQNCYAEDGTVVAAHSNQAIHGKGGQIKASDVYVASLCFDCHRELDQGKKYSEGQKVALWTSAHVRTVEQLTRLGKWPAGVPVPEEA